ncbi:MAG: polyhydroxyalkanoate synthesis regulator DNA-binding domain-containing protein [Desulfobacterales bacterium]|jgi:polyhydroxyalkanoate synthesis repressor PhaR|nr:polyhydroxyalkanoate synthesis regulator DNA-binding domain-containing protein [Desulfobacterales bacterium]MDP6684248.1 polyhydroxyalkanoate synthesis regulator DNA-binding domain-containing protein [Desulfobacterales bacterium]MDP6808106.1 polyhydroxyalkanoate synthesis regulator DNA-binding domain-containing protein [Desulfobacterales bacterium]|tara:strand:- start:63050 stop:63508 length:459 start_codon:yes stop_codon:yes gene_type:complete
MAKTILIKKYPNRRLYDTEKSQYISLNHVADMVRQGCHVEVMEVKTEEDVTAFILTQILMEEAKKNNALLPVPFLHLIIQYGENILSEFFGKYLQQIVRNYLAYKKSVDEQFKSWLEQGMDFPSMAGKTMTTPFKSFFDLFSDSTETKEKKK